MVYRASQPGEQIIRGTLEEISEKVKADEIAATAMIVVGHCLDAEKYEKSKLYSPTFSHGFRKAKI